MGRRLALPAVLASTAVLAAGCGGGDDDSTAAGLPDGCEAVDPPTRKQVNLEKPKRLQPPPKGTVAVVETSCGEFEIALEVERSPKTAASFAYLVEEGVYDRTAFHRIVPDFVIQGGDPRGDGTGGPGYSVDEAPPARTQYTEGTVAMAKTEAEPPGRSGSQFFVVVAPDAGLPADFAVLGEVSSGLDVTQRIAAAGDVASGQTGAPVAPVIIDGISLQQ